ncbi:MAG TPA: TetR/AcrR family transcriptional regulator [Nocardioidaceae bacterium]|jgi:AcrR family transcriptional regulator
MSAVPPRNRRADARRSRASILDAAVRLLDSDPDASVEAIARAAGVTRQTVYAHFPTRQDLLGAVLDRITEESVAAMDAAEVGAGTAADVLLRLLDAGAGVAGRHRALLQRIGSLPVSPQEDERRHAPVADRLRAVVVRGQQAGELDDDLPVDWVVTAVIRLGHAASEEADAGRMPEPRAREVLRTTVLRVLGTGVSA